jgi:hypothetical protein
VLYVPFAVADEGPYTVLVRYDNDTSPPQEMRVPQFLAVGLYNATLFVYDRFGRFGTTPALVSVTVVNEPCTVSVIDTNATWGNCETTLSFGESCNVTCMPGYKPTGDTLLVCSSSGLSITVTPGFCECMSVNLLSKGSFALGHLSGAEPILR